MSFNFIHFYPVSVLNIAKNMFYRPNMRFRQNFSYFSKKKLFFCQQQKDKYFFLQGVYERPQLKISQALLGATIGCSQNLLLYFFLIHCTLYCKGRMACSKFSAQNKVTRPFLIFGMVFGRAVFIGTEHMSRVV